MSQNLNQLMEAWVKKGHLSSRRIDIGRNSRNRKDLGVDQPPRNRIKTDWENKDIQSMYEGAGYSTKRGVIHVEVDRGGPPSDAMTGEECEFHVVGLVLANMYNLKKGTELFGNKADEAVLQELTEIDTFETHELVHKDSLSYKD